MFFLFFCNLAESVPPSTEQTIVEPERHEVAKTSSPKEILVPLEPAEKCSPAKYTPRTRDTFSTTHQHPNAESIDLYFSPKIGADILMVGLEQDGQTWNVSVDIDKNGIIQDNERFTMLPQTPGAEGPIHVAKFNYPYPTPEIPDHKVKISLTLEERDEQLVMIDCIDSGRNGEIPVSGGVSVRISGVGGDFNLPKSALIVDGNRDGKPDGLNFLNHYTVEEGLVLLPDDNVYEFSIDTAGTMLRLRPTDKPLTGLHFLAAAPNFEGKATDGKTHKLSDYSGEVLLLDFWATWCGPCVALHPEIEKFAIEQNLTVLGISADNTNQEVKRWLKKNPTPWPSIAQGPLGEINTAYAVNTWPTHVLIDSQGRLIAYGRWGVIKEAVINQIWEPKDNTNSE